MILGTGSDLLQRSRTRRYRQRRWPLNLCEMIPFNLRRRRGVSELLRSTQNSEQRMRLDTRILANQAKQGRRKRSNASFTRSWDHLAKRSDASAAPISAATRERTKNSEAMSLKNPDPEEAEKSRSNQALQTTPLTAHYMREDLFQTNALSRRV
jgi:hypothetical protein